MYSFEVTQYFLLQCRVVIIVGGESAPICAPPRRPCSANPHASLTKLDARSSQLSGLADQHQSPPCIGRIASELARQSTVRQDSRDENESRKTAYEA